MVDKASRGSGVSCRHGSPAEVVKTDFPAAKPLPARTKGSTARFRGDAIAGNRAAGSAEEIKVRGSGTKSQGGAVNCERICVPCAGGRIHSICHRIARILGRNF